MRVRPEFSTGLPDIPHLICWPVGMQHPLDNDFYCIAGCVLREAGRLAGDLQFLEAAEGLEGVIKPELLAEVRIRVGLVGISLDTSCLRNGHSPIPPSWMVLPREKPRFGEPPEALILTGTRAQERLAEVRVLDRGGYFRLMESCGVGAHAATRVLFNTLETALTVTERRELTDDLVERLSRIGEQLTNIFARRGATW